MQRGESQEDDKKAQNNRTTWESSSVLLLNGMVKTDTTEPVSQPDESARLDLITLSKRPTFQVKSLPFPSSTPITSAGELGGTCTQMRPLCK